MLQKCQTPGCSKTAFLKSNLRCSRCTAGTSSSATELLPHDPYNQTERLIPNDQPVFMGVDLAAPGQRDYSIPAPSDYLGGGGDFGGGGASSSYSSDSSSNYSSSDSSSSSSDSSGSSSSSDW